MARQPFEPNWPRHCENCPEHDADGRIIVERQKPAVRVRVRDSNGRPTTWYICQDCFLGTRHDDGTRVFAVARSDIDILQS